MLLLARVRELNIGLNQMNEGYKIYYCASNIVENWRITPRKVININIVSKQKSL